MPVRGVPAQGRAHRVQQYQQAAAARVNHAGIGQHVELLGGLVQCDGGGIGGGEDHVGQVGTVGGDVLGGARSLLQHRDDGAGHGFAHRRDGQSDGMAQRGAEDGAIDVGQRPAAVGGCGGGDVGEPAQDLGQDDARIAACAVQRATCQRGGDLRNVIGAGLRVGLLPRRTHREQHVCPGVGVSDREHVESVDLVGVRNQVADRGMGPVPQGGGIQPSSHPHLQPSRAAVGASLASAGDNTDHNDRALLMPVDAILVIPSAAGILVRLSGHPCGCWPPKY